VAWAAGPDSIWQITDDDLVVSVAALRQVSDKTEGKGTLTFASLRSSIDVLPRISTREAND
jgi:hypothetical protein